jgi:hypothetical protein
MSKPNNTITPQQQGDAKPQFIDNTKYDNVHGIDKAFVMNNHLHLCIAEVKSQYSQCGKDKNGIEQMSKQWITERLQKLQQQYPKHPLIVAIKDFIAHNGSYFAFSEFLSALSGLLLPANTQRNSNAALAARIKPERVMSNFRVSTLLPCFAQNSLACRYASAFSSSASVKGTLIFRLAIIYISLSIGIIPVLEQPAQKTTANT